MAELAGFIDTKRGRRPRTSKFDERRDQLLTVAARVFRAKGYEGASLKDIADELGVSKAGLYNYIATKDDLLYELTDEVFQAHIANMERVQASGGDVLTKLRMLIEGHVQTILDSYANGRGFYVDFSRYFDARRMRELLAPRISYERYVEVLISGGIEQGLICPDIDPFMAQVNLLSSVNSIFRWYDPERFHSWRRLEGGNPETAAALIGPQYADSFLASVVCDRATHEPGHRRLVGAPVASG